MLTYLSKELYVSEKEKIKGHFFYTSLYYLGIENKLEKYKNIKTSLKSFDLGKTCCKFQLKLNEVHVILPFKNNSKKNIQVK